MEPFYVAQGNTYPKSYWRIIDFETGIPVDLSGADTTVEVHVRQKGGTTVLDSFACRKLWLTGWVEVEFPDDIFEEVDVGRYEAQIEIDFDGEIQTVLIYFWDGYDYDTAPTLPIGVKEKFA